MNDKLLYIIRGVPGSGKTTLAHLLVGQENTYEADQFMVDEAGNYKFDGARLPIAHRECFESLLVAMMHGVPRLAVANTFVRKEHYFPFVTIAEEYGYNVSIITMNNRFRSVHNVPEATVERMIRQFEH